MVAAVVGNDVVDLTDPHNSNAHARDRFVMRVFDKSERDAIRMSSAPNTLLWTLFAAKEAAYKALCKMRARVAFAHRRFVVSPDLASVHYGGDVFSLSIVSNGAFVHAVACTPGSFPLHRVRVAGTAQKLSDAVRALALEHAGNLLRCSPEELCIVRDVDRKSWDDLGPPRLLRRGKPTALDVSLSHDGSFAAMAMCVTHVKESHRPWSSALTGSSSAPRRAPNG